MRVRKLLILSLDALGGVCELAVLGLALICAVFPAAGFGDVDRDLLDRIVTNRVVSSKSLSHARGWLTKAKRNSGASDGDLRRALEVYIARSAASDDRTVQSQNCAMAIRAYSTLTSTNGFAFLAALAKGGTNEISRTAYAYYCQAAPIPQRIAFSEQLLDDGLVAAEMRSQVWLEWGNVICWRQPGDDYRNSVEQALQRRRNHNRDGARCEAILRKAELRPVPDDEPGVSETRDRRIGIMLEALKRK